MSPRELAVPVASGEVHVDGVLLQDWVSLSLGSGVSPNTITQGADRWLDLANVGDVVFYLDVKQADTGATISYQTAPCREDASFVTMVAVPLSATTRADLVLAGSALVPVARYVRWLLTFGSLPSRVTFRLWVSTYSFA